MYVRKVEVFDIFYPCSMLFDVICSCFDVIDIIYPSFGVGFWRKHGSNFQRKRGLKFWRLLLSEKSPFGPRCCGKNQTLLHFIEQSFVDAIANSSCLSYFEPCYCQKYEMLSKFQGVRKSTLTIDFCVNSDVNHQCFDVVHPWDNFEFLKNLRQNNAASSFFSKFSFAWESIQNFEVCLKIALTYCLFWSPLWARSVYLHKKKITPNRLLKRLNLSMPGCPKNRLFSQLQIWRNPRNRRDFRILQGAATSHGLAFLGVTGHH